ncbi:MAG TPA: TIGR04076 family protein [Clostridiales bacterium]|nr:TIGR04076 family protein [Clostridiales bacterium]
MSNECAEKKPSVVEVRVTESECPAMPAGDVLVLEGPAINYEKSGPVCLTAINAIYPWIMATRFGVKTEVLDYDEENSCYHAVCPCGAVHYDIRKMDV